MKNCESCDKEHDGTYGSGRFCSQPCSKSFSTREKRAEINQKISATFKATKPRQYLDKICPTCSKEFKTTISKKNKKFCSVKCSGSNFRNRYNKDNPEYAKHIADARINGMKSSQLQKEIKRSKNEIMFAELCIAKFPDTLTNEGMFNGWDADVVIPQLKIAVLWNGAWHYKEISKKNSLLQIQNRDKIKLKEIEKAGYTPYVIKDMGKFNKDFVNEKWLEFLEYLKNNDL